MHIEIFDSTLRDGAQAEGISFTTQDKINIVKKLDKLGVDYIEAGNPASNPKDMEFFDLAKRMQFKHSTLVAFGSTRRKNIDVADDKGIVALLETGVSVVSIVGKSSIDHVLNVLGTTKEENLAMIADTVLYLVEKGKTVIFDAEHFFDGYRCDAEYAMQTLITAQKAGATTITLCDTNGGSLCHEVQEIFEIVKQKINVKLSVHCHNDIGLGVANSVVAVKCGATQVQGTFLGFGERCGNANLSTVIPLLSLKLGYDTIPNELLTRLTKTARYIADIANITLPNAMPFVGKSAFAHKGGMHVDGVHKEASSFEHITPESVGNQRSMLISEMAGRTAVLGLINDIDSSIERDSIEAEELVALLKEQEHKGYLYETAAASLELIMRKRLNKFESFFELLLFKVIGEKFRGQSSQLSTALIKIKVGENIEIAAAEGEGPVHALDVALKKAVMKFYPLAGEIRLIDYKVRVMEPSDATAAMVRVTITSSDGEDIWTTVGVSRDIIDASLQALTDSIEYKLMISKNKRI